MAHVLVLDDEPDLLALCEIALARAGHEVETFSNAEDVIEHVRSVHPDLILLDWVIPGTSGEVVLDQLQATPATRPIPVVVMTALEGLDTHARLKGARTVLHKPFKSDQLTAEVDRIVGSAG